MKFGVRFRNRLARVFAPGQRQASVKGSVKAMPAVYPLHLQREIDRRWFALSEKTASVRAHLRSVPWPKVELLAVETGEATDLITQVGRSTSHRRVPYAHA